MANDWLAVLMSGLGGAFTGAGVAQDRRRQQAMQDAAMARQAELDRMNAFTAQLNQRRELDELGFRPAAEFEQSVTRLPVLPGSGALGQAASAGFAQAQRGETIETPVGRFTQNRAETPRALRMRDVAMRREDARAELERRATERRQERADEMEYRREALRAARGRGTGMTMTQENTQANILAGRYDADPIVKNAKEIAQAYGRVLSTQDNAAGDLSLIFAYMKMLDPGSVVREGEFANAQNAAGVPDQIRNLYNRTMSGERLNPNQRGQFRAQAKAIANQQRDALKRTRERYTKRAGAAKLNVDPTLLFDDPFELFDADAGAGGFRLPYSPDED